MTIYESNGEIAFDPFLLEVESRPSIKLWDVLNDDYDTDILILAPLNELAALDVSEGDLFLLLKVARLSSRLDYICR